MSVEQEAPKSSGPGYADTHFHLWDLDANYYPFLTDKPHTNFVIGDYSALKRNYLIGDFLDDARGVPISKGVHIEADHDPVDPVRETRWLQAVADDPASRGFPHAIVASCELDRASAERQLVEHVAYPNVRGIRQSGRQLPAELLEHVAFQRHFAMLRQLRLSFDLRVRHPDMITAARLAQRHSDTQFIVTHTGYRASEERSYVEAWRRGMTELATLPNVAVKISGFGFLDQQWKVESIRPMVLDTIEIFGPSRCMFASNFPVDKLTRDYASYWTAYEEITRDFSSDERRGLFLENAERIYRI